MRLGVAWYPEQHPPERWADDVRRMAASGLDLVRMGEFAWVTLEPRRGRFEWDGMDLAIELAVGAGLEVVLATPTAAPPIWLAMEHPEILSMGPDGQRQAYGTRRSTCPVNRRYRTESRRIVSALVDRYGKHPGVVAWQLDNEPGHHDSARCWCPDCDVAFQAWLQARYDTIGELNRAWGTVFWGGSYPSFEAIRLPRASATNHSPSLLLAHRRFASANVVEGIAEQHALVDEGAPGRVVFSNLPAAQTNLEPRPLSHPRRTRRSCWTSPSVTLAWPG
jgi:beta-galactosidase